MNGFSHGHTKRRNNSEGDTQSFGKENLSYQLQMTTTHHSSDDSKDFASLESCLQEVRKYQDLSKSIHMYLLFLILHVPRVCCGLITLKYVKK